MCLIVPLLLFAGLLLGAYLLTPRRERLSLREFAGDDRFVQVQGYAIHYQDDGPADAPTVVLVHGFGAWAFTWRAQRRALLAAGYRVITTDQIGYGASARPAGPVYTTELQATLLAGALDALGVRAAHFVGHSFGGRVAMQLALDDPARVRSLVVLAPEAFASMRPPIARLVDLPVLGYALAFYSTAPRLVRPGLRFVSKAHAWLTEDVVQGYAAPVAVRGTTLAQVWQARSPKDSDPARAVPARLRELGQRTLVIWGAADPVFPVADAHRLLGMLPNATLRVIEGSGHLPHEEYEPATTAAILEFLRATTDD